MCGIVGYIGEREASSILIEALKRLEYRGYDSAGIALLQFGLDMCAVAKVCGKVEKLEKMAHEFCFNGAVSLYDSTAQVGIAHTRWATHGKPSVYNAHPHGSGNAHIMIVHNGIVENYEALRTRLVAEGFHFISDTDTEVIPHLIDREFRSGTPSFEEAVARALGYVEGAYAIAVVSSDHPDEIVAACYSSSLVIGIGKDELFLASDELAFAGKVNAVVHLKDGELVVLKRNGSYTFHGIPINEVTGRIEKPGVAEQVTKGGYPHYMLKEIFEQPQAMRNVLAGRLRERSPIAFGGFTGDIESRLTDARRIILVGCGTSLFAAMAARDLIESLCGVICEVEQAAEFAYRNPVLSYADVVVGVSQSGETADTLEALALAKKRHALCLGVTNRVGSAVAKRTRVGMYLHAGPEIAVASTKAFTAQAAVLALFALRIAELRGIAIPEPLRHSLVQLHQLLAESLTEEPRIQALAQKYANAKRMIVIGRGSGVSLAMEAALKIREVSYIDAHGLSAAELKHGTLALVEPGVPVLAIMPQGAMRAKMFSSVEEIKARGGEVILFDSKSGIPDELVPTVLAPQLQLLAYHLGVANGVDVDQPRNLAKSVTVG